MVKPIYCNLLLLFSCLIYEACGGHHNVRHIRMPSRVIPNNIRPYDSSSSSTTINDAGENTATQPSSPRILRKSFSSNNAVGYDRNHGSVQDNKSSNYFGPYDLSSSSNTAIVAGDDSAAQSPSPRLRRNSFRSNDALRYDRNHRSVQDNKSQSSMNCKQKQNYMDSNNLNNGQMNNNMISSFSNNKPLSDLNNRNMQNDNTSENQGIGKRQNSIISNFQDYPNIKQTIINPLVRRLGSLRQNSLPSSLNKDASERISDGNENSSITNMMNSNKNTFNDPEQKIVSMSIRECCINNKCRVLKDGEKCDIEDYFKSIKNTKQQNGDNDFIMSKLMSGKLMPFRLSPLKRFGDSFNEDSNTQEIEKPKTSMFGTPSNGDNDFKMPKLMDGQLKPFMLGPFNRFGDSFNEDNNTQEPEKPKNMGLDSTGYSTIFPSFGSSYGIGMPGMGMPGMGSSITMPEQIKPNYPYSKPNGLSEDEANKIRNDVLQKSNFYRNKFQLQPFTLDDQLTNCAQDWANNMAKQQSFDHRPDNVYGENLYGNQNLKNLGETAVDSWYNEMSMFTINNVENFNTFHMTQLLWRKSTVLGVGVSQNPENGMYYVVANYDPKGNLLEHFKENLPEITEEDIEEAKKADKRLKAKLAKPVVTSWSSGSSTPFGSGRRNYMSNFN